MKVTLNWLKEYVDFDWSPEELTERLTMLGLEVEGVQKITGDFEGVVVAQVLTREKHPDADKLSLCRVNDGKGERQIVCGAQNFKAGDKVPLILPGSSLPPKPGDKAPFTIKVGKIRGVESHGMLCSHEELGIDPEAIGHKKEDGLLILREEAKVGQSLSEYLGRTGGDVVYDLEVTPNRPDLNSVIGIAREIAAVTGNPLRLPSLEPQVQQANGSNVQAAGLVSVVLENAEACPRYTARIIKGVKVGSSPDWLRSALEKVGIRSISNVVDVTNFVMLEIGQPLHAFDYHLITRGADGIPAILVRNAHEGEKFTTLDGVQRSLTAKDLLIADSQKGIALAGIMGGQNTEINPHTVDVLIESAYFKPQTIRATSKRLELRSDSSYRFERGGDVNICDWASRRAVQLILQTAGGQVAEGVVEAFPHPVKDKEITLRHRKVCELLGVPITPGQSVQFLQQLGFKLIVNNGDEYCTVSIPSHRVDMKREVDLIEEIARLYGVNKIPATAPRGAIGFNAYDAIHDQMAEVREILSGLGLDESQGQTLISGESAKLVSSNIVPLQNPLSADMDVLRPSLIPGLLDALWHNLSRKNNDLAIFEVGRVFTSANGGTKEERRVAIAITGQRAMPFWSGDGRDAKFDAYDLKGLLEELFETLGLRGVAYNTVSEKSSLYLEHAAVTLGGKLPFGGFGQLLPALAKTYDLRDAVFIAEFDLDALLARRNANKSFKPLPQFPSSRRDVAMIVPEATTHDAVLQAVKQAKPANLEAVELFDVFRGKHVPEGCKSLAYAFTYRGNEKTLTDAEVNASHTRVVESFKSQLQATLRE